MPFFTISSPSSGNATQLQGNPVAATAPATGAVLAFDGTTWRAAQGVTGPTGAHGRDGHTLYAGSGAPASNFGYSGDWYIDTATANLYGPKANGSWGSAFGIQGGPTGPTGNLGPTGAASIVTGPTGPVSTTPGPTGPASTVTGPTGPTSTTPGPTGATGPASTVPGPTGSTGPASTVTGPTGPSGGPTGPTGPGARGGAAAFTATGPVTLTDTSARHQFILATGTSVDVTLPTGIAAGFDFLIRETGASYTLNVKDYHGTFVATLGSYYYAQASLIVFDGTVWRPNNFTG